MLPVADTLGELLVQPILAIALGVLLGLSVLWLTRAGTRFVTPNDPGRGLVFAMILMFSGVICAFGSLLLYFLFSARCVPNRAKGPQFIRFIGCIFCGQPK